VVAWGRHLASSLFRDGLGHLLGHPQPKSITTQSPNQPHQPPPTTPNESTTPLQGDDYILYCHPSKQKVPRSDRLRGWYHEMLKKAREEGTVVGMSTLFDSYFEGGRCAWRACVRLVEVCVVACVWHCEGRAEKTGECIVLQ
jgi:hypothetical protein